MKNLEIIKTIWHFSNKIRNLKISKIVWKNLKMWKSEKILNILKKIWNLKFWKNLKIWKISNILKTKNPKIWKSQKISKSCKQNIKIENLTNLIKVSIVSVFIDKNIIFKILRKICFEPSFMCKSRFCDFCHLPPALRSPNDRHMTSKWPWNYPQMTTNEISDT